MLEGTPKVIDMNDKYINHVERLTNLLKSDQLNQETKIEIEDTIQAYLKQMQQLQIAIPFKKEIELRTQNEHRKTYYSN